MVSKFRKILLLYPPILVPDVIGQVGRFHVASALYESSKHCSDIPSQ